MYQRDLDALDPAGVYPITPNVPISTANGVGILLAVELLLQDENQQSIGN
jgi:hypothetical protein